MPRGGVHDFRRNVVSGMNDMEIAPHVSRPSSTT